MTGFRLAHISDLHLEAPAGPRWFELLGKRAIGHQNWMRRRRHRHQRRILDRLARDLGQQNVDHTVITGDLVNLALPGEFAAVAGWLREFGDPRDVTVVPGNHDAYVRVPFERALGQWREYLAADEATSSWFSAKDAPFPFVRIRGDVALVGLSSAVPTPPFMAYGRLGRSQLERLAVILRRLAKDKLFRVILIHHPPISASAARWNHLLDERALQDVIRRNGAELILHGHLHRRSIRYLNCGSAFTPVVGVPSASLAWRPHRPSAAYNLYQIARKNGEWSLEIKTRSLKPTGQGFSDAAFAETSTPTEVLRPPRVVPALAAASPAATAAALSPATPVGQVGQVEKTA
jgi:3',5'-cyclic AMP phosphodiesterase CpdA